jgi:hypothetical protein
MSTEGGLLKTVSPLPPLLRQSFNKNIASKLVVDAGKFNVILLKHQAVVAGSFCIPPFAAYAGSRIRVSPGDMDVWVAKERSKGLLEDLVALLKGPQGWFSNPQWPVSVTRGNTFELSQYRRLREDVENVDVVRAPLRSGPKRITVQVMSCRNLSRALSTFDINVCSLAWTGDALQVWAPHAMSGIQKGVMSLNPKALERQSAAELQRTLLRVRKYIAYGFTLSSTAPLVEALHEHFGVSCEHGSALCANYVAYFMDRNKPLPQEDEAQLKKQAERAQLVKKMLFIAKYRESPGYYLGQANEPHVALNRSAHPKQML